MLQTMAKSSKRRSPAPRSLEAIGTIVGGLPPDKRGIGTSPRAASPRAASPPDGAAPLERRTPNDLTSIDAEDACRLLLWGRRNGFILGEVHVGNVRIAVAGDVTLMPKGPTSVDVPTSADRRGLYEQYGGKIFRDLAETDDDPTATYEDDDDDEPAPRRRGRRRQG
jgi:hypothetical protein